MRSRIGARHSKDPRNRKDRMTTPNAQCSFCQRPVGKPHAMYCVIGKPHAPIVKPR